jgi:hypothetical protein
MGEYETSGAQCSLVKKTPLTAVYMQYMDNKIDTI